MIKTVITAPRGGLGSLIVQEAYKRDDIHIVGGVGAPGRGYIGEDIGVVAGADGPVGAVVYDDIEKIIDECDLVLDFSTVELSMEVLESCRIHGKSLICGTTGFTQEQAEKFTEAGKDILTVDGLSKTIDGEKVLNKVSFIVRKGDKIAFVGENALAATTLFKILAGEMEPDEGSYKWGVSTSQSYFPNDNSAYFEGNTQTIIEWLRQYSTDETETYLRGFLGRMLFSGDDVYKPVNVLSGGEKVRCMFSRMMLFGSNVLMLDRPTDHLDLESITAVNNGLCDFKGNILFASHDHEFIQTIANRIIELNKDGIVDKFSDYEDYVQSKGGHIIL